MSESLLSCRNVVVEYRSGGKSFRAVDGVDLDIARGETLALVGESGCGKSSLARAIMGLVPVASGSITLEGREISGMRAKEMRPLRPQLQMVFQNPYGSLNPRQTVGWIIEEPMMVHRMGAPEVRKARVRELLDLVGLSAGSEKQYPHEFSGGQRQRIAIARALSLNPKLIVCDEPVSALDVSVQAQIINLLVRLQRELGVSYLFISHDLAVVRYLAEKTAVMYLGKVISRSTSRKFWDAPGHPYVAALKNATPSMANALAGVTPPVLLSGEIPSAFSPPPGCHLSNRCIHAMEICKTSYPPMKQHSATEISACHLLQTEP